MTTPKKIFKSFLKPFFSSSNKGKNEEDLETIAAQEQKQFPFEVLVSATKDFHPDHKLGEGGFGPVFKGKLSDGRQIAVKKLSHCSRQGMKEFKNEAKLLARAQHRNVVNLLGYCVHGVEKLLVYEYVSNESLDKILFKSANRDALSWRQRQDIIVGIARGLFYLHEGSPTCIIHRDIKASNILLDDKWVPKIADFGMARLYPEDETHVNTHVAGTHGYMAPEYIRYGHLSVKTDVFSFGVVVLELISGQKNSTFNGDPDSRCLLEWADRIYKKGRSWEIMDPALAQSAIPDEIAMYIQIGLLCSQSDPRLRPTMQQVSVMLSKSPGSLDREPTRPGYPGSRIRSHRPGGGTSHTAGTSGASNPSTFSSSSISNTVSATASSSAPTPKEVSEVPQIDEVEAEVSIGNKIPDMNLSDEIPCEVSLNCCTNEEHFTSSAHFHEIDQHGLKEDQDKLVELKLLSLEFDDDHVLNNESSMTSKLDEIEEEKVPETPTSNNSFYQLHKKLLLLEKKDFGTESLDGSVVSELEGGDAVSSIEHLKSALKAERKALHALYTELEEERSASAVAANQTMAMINKLQEEKSAMQMEALQYQRMMEEQSEYDQEALQLLNELMVKREKEKQELEKELEVYRKRLSEYEAKEKAMRMLKRSKDGSVARSGLFSSASCSNGEDSEELSIDLNQEPKEDVNFYCHQECDDHDKVQVDAFLELEESFVDFEEERMSILEQLKMLEEKLISMDDEDAKEFEDVRPMDDSYRENGDHTEENSRLDGEINEHANGFLSEMNGKLIINAKGKGLLPLFDAMSDENGDVMINGHENGFHFNGVDEENKKLDVEEELDLLHERLQALEADREFLKNCISSLKKGDKGMDLLHEILQHLRDLKNVDLRVRSSSNGLIL